MTDDFFTQGENKSEAPVETQQEQPVENKIKLGDREYSQEELSQKVGLADEYQAIEKRYNTKLGNVWPAYGQAQEENRRLKEELERVKQGVTDGGEIDPVAIQRAKEAARKIGITTDDALGDFMEKEFRNYYKKERAAEKLTEELDGYETQLDGKDGRPAFRKETILNHMYQTGIRVPEKAYKDLYEKELDTWREQQLGKSRRPGLVTETTSTAGGKQPTQVRPTRDNLDQLVREALYEGQ